MCRARQPSGKLPAFVQHSSVHRPPLKLMGALCLRSPRHRAARLPDGAVGVLSTGCPPELLSSRERDRSRERCAARTARAARAARAVGGRFEVVRARVPEEREGDILNIRGQEDSRKF